MNKFNDLIEKLQNEELTPKKVRVELELDAAAVQKIENLAEQDIKSLLEAEINNVEAFIDIMGYNNW